MLAELTRLDAIREQVEAGKRLSFDDGLALESSNDLFALGAMANLVRERYNGNFGYYNVNTHINPTNVCVYTCSFCAFRADLNEAKAYVLDRAAVIDRARQASERGATELHIVGGLHHKLPFTYYVDVVRWIKETAPEIHVKAYTAVEIEFFAKISRLSTEQVLRQLIDAGLGSLPGGGAEIFHPEVREQICGAKASTEQWLDVHRTAHRLGLHSNATMLYGHPPHRQAPAPDRSLSACASCRTTAGKRSIPLWFHAKFVTSSNYKPPASTVPAGVRSLRAVSMISTMMTDGRRLTPTVLAVRLHSRRSFPWLIHLTISTFPGDAHIPMPVWAFCDPVRWRVSHLMADRIPIKVPSGVMDSKTMSITA